MKTTKRKVLARVLSVLMSLTLICGLIPAVNAWADEGWIQPEDYTQLVQGTDYDYSFAVLGDIQHITDYTPDDLHYLFDYIINNKDAKNIQFVFGMGDITNRVHDEAVNLQEWAVAQPQHFRLTDAGIPYTVVRGNHDNVDRMNAYFADPSAPAYMNQLDGLYQEGSVMNVWKTFSAGGVDYLNVVLNWEISDSVIEWAADVIDAHPNHRVIISTHVYLKPEDSDGDGYEDYQNEANPTSADWGEKNNPQQLWDKLISQHENIFLVLSGHESSDDVHIQQRTGVHGNTVTEMRVDSQTTDLTYMLKDGNLTGGEENGVGMVTMLYFKNDGTTVAVEHYSVLRNMYRAMQTFTVAPYAGFAGTEVYAPDTDVVDASAIWQDGLGSYSSLQELLDADGDAYDGGGASILAANGMDVAGHSFALHSGSRTVEPGAVYTVSYKLNGLSGATRVYPYIHYKRTDLGGADTYEPLVGSDYLRKGPVTDWQTVSFDLSMDDKTSAVEIWLVAVGGDAYVDDFSLIKKANANPLPDFESDKGSAYFWNHSGGTQSLTYLENGGADGSGAVQATSDALCDFRATDAKIAVEANTVYELSYRVKLNAGMTATPRLTEEKTSGMNYGVESAYAITGTGAWQEVRAFYTTASDAISVQPGILMTAGTMIVDYFTLRKAINYNLIPEFEENKGEIGFYAFGDKDSLAYSATGGEDGSGAVVINFGETDASHNHIVRLTSATINVKPNTTYRMEYKLKAEPGVTVFLWGQHFHGSAGNYFDKNYVTTTGGWQTFTFDYETDAEDTTLRLNLYFRNAAAGTTATIDYFTMCDEAYIPAEIMTNGDFENGTDGAVPTGFYTMTIGGTGKVEKVSGAGVNGSAAMHIEPRPGYILKTDDSHRIDVLSGTSYTLSYKVRVPSGFTKVYPVIRQYAAGGSALAELALTDQAVSATDGWQEVTAAFTTDASAATVAVCLQAYGGQVDVDNLSLRQGGAGANLITNGDFSAGANGAGTPVAFAGEKVQGKLDTGKVVYVRSGRPNTVVLQAKVDAGVLYACDGATKLGTVQAVYDKLKYSANLGLRVSNQAAADAVTAWLGACDADNLWIIAANTAYLDAAKSAKPGVRCVVDCTAATAIEAVDPGDYTAVLVASGAGTPSEIARLQEQGLTVIAANMNLNLLPDFEDSIGSAYVWKYNGGTTATLSYQATGGADGSGAVYLTSDKDAAFRAATSEFSASVEPNTVYELSYRIKLQEGILAYPHVVYNDGISGTAYTPYRAYDITGTGDWQEVTAYITTPANASTAKPSIFIGAGTATIDYFTLRKAPSASLDSDLLTSGVDAILTTDALTAVHSLEDLSVVPGADVFAGASATLGADFGVNFYMTIPGGNVTGMKVQFIVDGVETVDDALEASGGYYRATVNIAAKDMTVPIVAKLLNGSDEVISRYVYTMKEYAEYIIENDGYLPAEKAVAQAMLTYGGYAQLYFEHRVTELANEVYSADISTADVSGVAKMSITGDKGSYKGASLMLKSQTAVRLNFSTQVDGSVPREGSAYYYVEYPVDAVNLGTPGDHVIGETTFTFSVLSFAKTVIEGSSEKYSDSYKNLMKSIVIYADAVQALD